MNHTIVLALALVMGTPAVLAVNVAGEVAGGAGAQAFEREALREDHHSAEDPIDLQLELAGEPNRGRSSVLKATLTALWDSYPDALVRIHAPESVLITPYTEKQVNLALGESKVVAFNVKPLREGTHELQVSVQAGHETLGTVGNARSGILVIGEDGFGRFHVDMLPPSEEEGGISNVPDEEATLALRSLEELPRDAQVPDADAADPLPPPADRPSGETGESVGGEGEFSLMAHTFQVRACWYYQTEPGGWAPQRFATVQVRDSDEGWNDDLLWQGITGNDGCFTSSGIPRSEDDCCGRGNQDVYIRFLTSNTWTRVRTTGGSTYSWATGAVTVGSQTLLDFGHLGPGNNEFATRSFQYINNGGWFARNHAGVGGLGQVEVQQPSSRCSGMCYVRADDDIHIPSHRDRSPDDANHEYGHYVHDKLYGDSFWPSPGGPHNLCDDNQNRGLAWTEGFANFFGPRANHEVNAPGANGDTSYSRPWNGGSWSISLESGSCGSVAGDDNEMNVARSLWDLRDAPNDGTDQSSNSNPFIFGVASACDDSNYRDFYDQGCGWVSQGGSRCSFVTTAFQNSVNFNTNPSVAVTSQGAFQWVRGVIVLTASASDLECAPTVEFRVSSNNFCSTLDTFVATDAAHPYARLFDTRTIPDDPSVWTCARANDQILWTGFDASSSHIGVDNTPPVVALDTVCNGVLTAGWCRGTVSFTGTASDALSGLASAVCSLNGGPVSCGVSVAASGIHTIVYTATDNAGNTASITKVFRIDNTLPAAALAPSGTGGIDGWWQSSVAVALSASDAHSGVASMECAVDGAAAPCGSLSVSSEGAHTVQAVVTDVAGNVRTVSIEVKIDDTPPELSLSSSCATPGEAGWCRGAVGVGVSASDARSGIWLVDCTLNGAPTPCGALGASADGVYDVFVSARDKAGNGASATLQYKIDATAPTLASGYACPSPGVPPWCADDATLAPTVVDATSGVAAWTCVLDGAEIPCGPTTVTGESMHAFETRARDAAGNEAKLEEAFGIDRTAPEAAVATECTLPDGDEDPATCGGPVKVKTSASDALSGVHAMECRLDGALVACGEFVVDAPGWHDVEVVATDKAGNVGRATARFFVGSPSERLVVG